jgi:Ca2+-binding RTX toxin-like protein
MPLQLLFKGFNYVDYYNGEYSNNDTLNGVVQTGSNSVALTPDWGIDIADSTVYAGGATTDTLANLELAIREANARGLTSMVRPLVDILYDQQSPTNPNFYYVPGAGYTAPQNIPAGVTPAKPPAGADSTSFRGFINPADLNLTKFFGSPTAAGSYDYMIVQEAKAAQAAGAKLFAVGTELDTLATDTDPTVVKAWTNLIADVRKVFKGSLTYSANWFNADKVTFWNKLDYVGIDGYVPLSNIVPHNASQNPSLASLIAGWTKVSNVTLPGSNETVGQALHGLSAIDYFDKLAASSISKKFIFTEIGYQNDTEAAADPTGSSHSGVTDPSLQASLYNAFFQAWEQAQDKAATNGGKLDGFNYALAGVYMWDWDPDTSKGGYDDWSTLGYPANSVITSNYSATGVTRVGTDAAQTLYGTSGDDHLYGKGGNDTLIGYGGNDNLIGGLGADRLSGGAGKNSFVYGSLGDSTVAASGRDLITDFSASDVINLMPLEVNVGEQFDFIGSALFSHVAGEIRDVASGGNTVLAIDTNGDGAADFAISLSGNVNLTRASLVF